MNIWTRLSLYESTDVVRNLFEKRHGRQLNAEKAREIVSAVSQGREFFTAADEAGVLVRPLLQYYGVLSLSRALILLLSVGFREAALPAQHGLSCKGWGGLLVPENWRPGELVVRVTKGSFLSMIDCTRNADTSEVFTGPYPSRLRFRRTRVEKPLLEASFTLKSVLARISELREIFEHAFMESASNYRAFVFTVSQDSQSMVDLFSGQFDLPPLEKLRAELLIPEYANLVNDVKHNFLPPEPHWRYLVQHPAGTNFTYLLPQIDNLADGTSSAVALFEPDLSVSRIGRYFLLSFFLGTLARYHPTSWLAIMQSRQKGDFLLPLVRESMNVIQLNFPTLVINELEG